jgi:hypothetical protein
VTGVITAAVTATGPNLIGSTTAAVSGPAPLTGDPRLGLLQDNGGLTPTMALQPDSPAIDAGSNAVVQALGLSTDQRGPGFPRMVNGTVDLGAVEFQGPFLSANQRFVAHLYRDLLGRAPDPAGLTLWSGLLDQGVSAYLVARAIENSPEHHLLEVRQLYERLLRREPDPLGLAGWVGFLNRGGTEEALQAQLLGSAEYISRQGGGTAAGFLDALYHDVLGRPLDPVGARGWGRWLAQGAPPAAVAAAVLGSLESDVGEVDGLYRRYLHRQADPVGLLLLTEALQQGVTNETAAVILLGCPEYYRNAQ